MSNYTDMGSARQGGDEQPVESPVGKTDTQKDTDESTGKQGRPEMDDTERSSDPAKSMSGKQPKPSNPEGSL